MLLFVELLRVQSFATNLRRFVAQHDSQTIQEVQDFAGIPLRSQEIHTSYDQDEFENGIRRNSLTLWLGVAPQLVVRTEHDTGKVLSAELWNYSAPVASEPRSRLDWTKLILIYCVLAIAPLLGLGLFRLGEGRESFAVRVAALGGGLVLLLSSGGVCVGVVLKLLLNYGAIAFNR